MIKNYFLITLRNLLKSKLYIFINVLGMGIALGCCIVAYFNYEFDATFDDHHKNAATIYRVSSVREFENISTLYGYAPSPLGEAIRQNIQDVSNVVRYHHSYSNLKRKDDLFPAGLSYVDPEFFDVFTFEFVSGSPDALKDKSRVVLSEETAVRLFGTVNVVGEIITQVYRTELKEVEVGGVFKKQPANSSFGQQAYMHYDNYYDEFTNAEGDGWKDRNTLFVQIPDEGRVDVVRNQLQTYRDNNNKVREDFIIKEYVLDPFVGMGRRDSANRTNAWTNRASPVSAVVGPTVMAVLILLIACFNLTNTAIAVSSRRLKEIGIRKVMGGLRVQLIIQFIGETMLVCFVSLLIGLLLGEVLLSAWNVLWENMKLTSHYTDNPGFLVFIIVMLIITGLLAGSYPAFYISRFEPVNILKGKLRFGGTNMFTRVLLFLQFGISLIAIISAIAFVRNAQFQRAFDLGFDQEGVITTYVNNRNEFETYRNALVQNPGIHSIAGSSHSIFSSRYNDPVRHGSKQLEVDIIDVGDGYLHTMGLVLLEGRDFMKDSETDRKESVIVTHKMAEAFGWDNPIGKQLVWMDTVKLYVIGVVKDVYTAGLWNELDPMMIRYTSPEKYSHLIVSTAAGNVPEMNKYMENRWREVFPNRLYNGWMLTVAISETTTVNTNIAKMFIFLGLVAIMLSATGLYTLVSLNIIKKMKEIGVRKVFGASVGNITRIVNLEFVIILGLASVAGSCLSYLLIDMLMDSIWHYYLSTEAITIIVSIALMFFISAVTIGYKVYSAASMNPVTTLRDE